MYVCLIKQYYNMCEQRVNNLLIQLFRVKVFNLYLNLYYRQQIS